jgi:2-polyprenyl-3-methyl-5-hydroxy-6-metoxy-1,4-benzoquinol methylase
MSSPTPFKCAVCDSDQHTVLRVKEMMFGKPDMFDYGLCQHCGCLQIMQVPQNLADFYPTNYYSYSSGDPINPVKQWYKKQRRKLILQHPNWLSFLLFPLKKFDLLLWIYRKLHINTGMRILDVGSGKGVHVRELREIGMDALGIDPYVDQDQWAAGSVLVQKKQLTDVQGVFDLITFHHSFEHLTNPLETLIQARSLLTARGKILLRIPTTSSWAFETYQEHWYQLDAPRHLFLYSHNSIQRLAERANLQILDLWCDSTAMQFIASEEYAKGITLFDERSFSVNKKTSLWSQKDLQHFKQKSHQANQALKGDQICVVLAPQKINY